MRSMLAVWALTTATVLSGGASFVAPAYSPDDPTLDQQKTCSIDLTCKVTDAEGKLLTQVRAQGNGAAEYTEFMKDFGLAGRRAATQVSEQLKQEMMANPQLR